MKTPAPSKKSGQTAVEYIMLIAVVVGVSVALKTPASRFLVAFFGSFSGRATKAAVKPTNENYFGGGTKGCATINGGSGCE